MNKKLRIILCGLLVAGVVAFRARPDLLWLARDYYGLHPQVLVLVFAFASLLTLACQIYVDMVASRTKLLHGAAGMALLALGMSLLSAMRFVTVWRCRDQFLAIDQSQQTLVILCLVMAVIGAMALWWEASHLRQLRKAH